jgi:hypothetical protein
MPHETEKTGELRRRSDGLQPQLDRNLLLYGAPLKGPLSAVSTRKNPSSRAYSTRSASACIPDSEIDSLSVGTKPREPVFFGTAG